MQTKTRITIGIASAVALGLTALGGVAIADNKGKSNARGGDGYHGKAHHGGKHKARRGKRGGHHMRGRGMHRAFKLLDTNKDGKISMEEIAAEQKRLIAAADVDGNGTLSAEEFRRRGRLIMSLRTFTFFDMMDADGNGQLSAAELNGPSSRWLSRKDGDKSGDLTREEIRPKWAEKMKRMKERRMNRDGEKKPAE